MKMNIIGLMSGSSCDGVDVALVQISEKSHDNYSFKLLYFENYPYSHKIKKKLLSVSDQTPIREISRLNILLGEVFSITIFKFLRKFNLSQDNIDLIGSHGHTVFHQSKKERYLEKFILSTFQIGEPSVITERTGISTIADFRLRDVACGGQGAPLASTFHYYFFKDFNKNIVVINIGGISNITFIRESGKISDVWGFDTGPGNMLIDYMVRRFFPNSSGYDKDGEISKKGRILEKLLDHLLLHPFISVSPPKSTGREDFGKHYAESIINTFALEKENPHNIIKTFVAYTAKSICDNIKKFLLSSFNIDEIVFTGGGAKNKSIIKLVKDELRGMKILFFDDYGINIKAVEAVAFGFLAYLTYRGLPGNIPKATGAKKSAVLGKIIPGKMKI